MKKVTSVLEYVLDAVLLIGGLNTIATAVFYHEPVSVVIVIFFGLAFVLGATVSLVGKLSKCRQLHYAGLMVLVFSLLFGFILELITEFKDVREWIDSLTLFLLAAYLRIKGSMEENDEQVHRPGQPGSH